MKKTIAFLLFLTALLAINESHGQVLNTKLQVTVRNDLGNLVEGATVTLYKTLEDYEYEENPVATATTDAKGRALFYELEPLAYFMHVVKDDLTNVGRGVQTSKLIEKKKNMLDVIIE